MSTTGSMEQFHTYSTYTYRNFSERMISDLEQIICNFSKLPRYQALLQFYTDIEAHLNDPKAHDFDIRPYSQQLIQQMYQAYLNAGYTGTIGDMLNSLVKNVEVATAKDSKAGYSRSKAETLSGFDTRLEDHNKLRKAHDSLYQQFVRQGVPGLEPYWYYNNELKNYPAEVGETTELKGWNRKEGTIYFSFNYVDSEETSTLLAFQSDDSALTFALKYVSGVTRLVITYGTTSKTLTLPFSGGGYDRVVFSYNPEVILIRDFLTTMQYINPLGDFVPESMSLGTGFGTSSSCLEELAYYPVDMNKSEMLFFLNT